MVAPSGLNAMLDVAAISPISTAAWHPCIHSRSLFPSQGMAPYVLIIGNYRGSHMGSNINALQFSII